MTEFDEIVSGEWQEGYDKAMGAAIDNIDKRDKIIATLQAEIERLETRTCEWKKWKENTFRIPCGKDAKAFVMDIDELPGYYPWVFCPICGGKIVLKPEGDDERREP